MNNITQITDHPTHPCPPPGCEHPTYDELQKIFARDSHDRTERMLAALRAPTMSERAQRALTEFGLPSTLPLTTHGKTTIGVAIAEETRP
jgi:hypothetical protein